MRSSGLIEGRPISLPPDSPSVLIVGAGPVGLSLACELARRNVAFRIIDKTDEPTTQSRALGVQARTLEVFESIGIATEAIGRGRPMRGIVVHEEGRPVAHLRFDFVGLETHFPMVLSLPQDQTERLLIDRLGALGGTVERSTELVGFSADDTGVTSTIKGPSGATEEVRSNWLVGTDGAKSPVRHGLGLGFEGKEYPEAFLLADPLIEWDWPDDEMVIEQGPEGPIVAFPMPEAGRWRLIAVGQVSESDDPKTVCAFFQDRLRARGVAGAVVHDPSWTSIFRIHRRLVGSFRKGRCFVAGDAAHIHSPAGGQGMNTGIQDVFNLAWKLDLVERGASPDSLLDSYDAERRPVAESVERATDTMTRMITLKGKASRGLRDGAMSVLAQFDAVRHLIAREMSELEIGYRTSPIVAEDHPSLVGSILPGHAGPGLRDALDFRHGPRPGDRVPDVSLTDRDEPEPGSRLFDHLDPTRSVLLLLDGESDPPADDRLDALVMVARPHPIRIVRVARRPVEGHAGIPDATVVDARGDVHHRFAARSAALYLIRPDGYVGYRAMPPDPDRLRAYLALVFVGPGPG